MTLQEAINNIPQLSVSGAGVKVSGVLGGSSALAGLTADLSGWTVISQIAANWGILLGSVVAALSLTFTIYKGFKNKKF
jgi:hypothetical protein|tara:strand:+ start:575 stop:811 length:237 start_codon:yes stop_codon:yes gene_type:complete